MTHKQYSKVKFSRYFLLVRVAEYPKQYFFCRCLRESAFNKCAVRMEPFSPQYRQSSSLLRGEKLNYKSVAKEISKPPFLGSSSPVGIKVYRVCLIHTFPLNVSNHAHIWYVT